jgi:hypothetical protein
MATENHGPSVDRTIEQQQPRFAAREKQMVNQDFDQDGSVLGIQDGVPIVPVVVEKHPWGQYLILETCPYCGNQHLHGGGGLVDDPQDFQGHRASHCIKQTGSNPGYILRTRPEEER